MTLTHLHLVLTHIPIMGVIFGFLLLLYYLFSKKEEIKKVAYIVFVLSALIMLPTFFSGEQSEEGVEDLAGVSESVIEQHEDTAKVAAGLTYLLGALALFGIFFKSTDNTKRNIMASVLVLSGITSGVMAQTANQGGQIRHSEIRSGNNRFSGEEKENGESAVTNGEKGEKDMSSRAGEKKENEGKNEEKEEKEN